MIRKLKVTPLGGVGEIGALNCMVYETEAAAVVVDCGSMFPENENPGVDLIIPDFTYLHTIKRKLKGIVFTHGHEDHCGATPYLLKEIDLPVYATPFTLELIRSKLKEFPPPKTPKLNRFIPGETLHLSPFEIETVYINHSIIDATSLAFKLDGGYVVHLTDWKIDKTPLGGKTTDLKKFKSFTREGVIALLGDSTNADRPGHTLSEREITRQIKKIASHHRGRIIITLFSSNMERVQELINIGRDLKRNVAFVGRSMHENTAIARSIGRLSLEGVNVVDVEQTRGMPDDRVLLLVTGTQAEPGSVLSRIAHDEFKPFKIRRGDLVLFSSRNIPGNEKNISNMINHLCRRGAKVLYEPDYDIHTSGHAHQEELKTILETLKPTYFIPIHGEYRHLVKHAELAVASGVKPGNVFIIENGRTLQLQKNSAVLDGHAPVGRVFIDGKGIGDVSQVVIRDRRHLADTGFVLCILMINRATGEVMRGPELISRGLTSEEESHDLISRAKKSVAKLITDLNAEVRTDPAELQEEVRVTLQRFFRKELDRKPVVIPVIMEV